MNNGTLFESESDPMTLRELKNFLDLLVKENPEFLDGDLYAECEGVRHRMAGIMNQQDMAKTGGRKFWEVVLMDEKAVDEEIEIRSKWNDRLNKEHSEYF